MITNAGGALLLGLLLLLGPPLLPWRCWLAATTLSISVRAAPAACWCMVEDGRGGRSKHAAQAKCTGFHPQHKS